MLERMRQEVGDLYPSVQVPATEEVARQSELFGRGDEQVLTRRADPVTYIWVRTVPCRRPGCGAPVPLVRQAWLRKKGGVVAAVPEIEDSRRLCWHIRSGATAGDVARQETQTGAGQAVCIACHTPASANYVKKMAIAGRMKESLAAVAVDGQRSKLYLPPTSTELPEEKRLCARLDALLEEVRLDPLDERMNTEDSTTVAGRGYGISNWRELFTTRQLLVSIHTCQACPEYSWRNARSRYSCRPGAGTHGLLRYGLRAARKAIHEVWNLAFVGSED